MVEIYTDGSAVPNPGNGGWGVVIYPNKENEPKIMYCGFVIEKTTNNKMELLAVTKAIEKAEKVFKNEDILIYTDSDYVKKGIMGSKGLLQGWVKGWIANNWKNSKKEPVKNKTEWICLVEKLQNTQNFYKIEWCKGHSTNVKNQLADTLANKGRERRWTSNQTK